MKTKQFSLGIGLALLAVGFTSCEKCHECHYEKTNSEGQEIEVELGEQCGDDLKNYEKNGIYIPSENTTYTVHCHEH